MCYLEFSSQGHQQRFNITPVNIATRWFFKYGFKCVFLLVIHRIEPVVELKEITILLIQLDTHYKSWPERRQMFLQPVKRNPFLLQTKVLTQSIVTQLPVAGLLLCIEMFQFCRGALG